MSSKKRADKRSRKRSIAQVEYAESASADYAPSIGYWDWCEACQCVSFMKNCACANSCNGSLCDECRGYDEWLSRQTPPDRSECPKYV